MNEAVLCDVKDVTVKNPRFTLEKICAAQISAAIVWLLDVTVLPIAHVFGGQYKGQHSHLIDMPDGTPDMVVESKGTQKISNISYKEIGVQ